MLRCIAIDDEPRALDIIERYARKIPFITLLKTFREPVAAIDYVKKEKPDLIFLDINMPDITGLQLSALFPEISIIFTTAYPEHAIECYEYNTVDYLLKPIVFERFLKAVNKAHDIYTRNKQADRKENSSSPTHISVKSGTKQYQLAVKDIIYLEKQGNYITIFLADQKILIRESMSGIFDILPQRKFVRVHKSYIVSLQHITHIEYNRVTAGNSKIPVGATYRTALRKIYSGEDR